MNTKKQSNREIKFRAWIQKDPYSDDETPEMEMCCDLAFEEYLPVNDLLKGVEHLMQYTGLKDKNGKDIYDGDIVKEYFDDDGDEIISIIKFKNGSFGLEDLKAEKNSYFEYMDNLLLFESIYGENICNFEIIGNIYENPELLETK